VLVKRLISPEEARELRREVRDLFERVLTGRSGLWGRRERPPELRAGKNYNVRTTCSSILRPSAGCSSDHTLATSRLLALDRVA
jgi:hypothetical protein